MGIEPSFLIFFILKKLIWFHFFIISMVNISTVETNKEKIKKNQKEAVGIEPGTSEINEDKEFTFISNFFH